jgi:hypothetical protein
LLPREWLLWLSLIVLAVVPYHPAVIGFATSWGTAQIVELPNFILYSLVPTILVALVPLRLGLWIGQRTGLGLSGGGILGCFLLCALAVIPELVLRPMQGRLAASATLEDAPFERLDPPDNIALVSQHRDATFLGCEANCLDLLIAGTSRVTIAGMPLDAQIFELTSMPAKTYSFANTISCAQARLRPVEDDLKPCIVAQTVDWEQVDTVLIRRWQVFEHTLREPSKMTRLSLYARSEDGWTLKGRETGLSYFETPFPIITRRVWMRDANRQYGPGLAQIFVRPDVKLGTAIRDYLEWRDLIH